jgi:hypothetical protein
MCNRHELTLSSSFSRLLAIVYFSAKRAINKGINMAPSAMASAAASSSAAVSSGSQPMAHPTPTPASMMATTTPPRPAKRNKPSPEHYYGHHPNIAYQHHGSHSYANPLLSPAMTTSSASQSSICNSPLSFDILPPSPGRNLLLHHRMPPLEQSNFVTPNNDPFRHRYPPLEDAHYHPHLSQQQQHLYLQPHQYNHHPEFLQHVYNPPLPPPPPPQMRRAPHMPPTAAATTPSPQGKSTTNGVSRGSAAMSTTTRYASLSPIQGPSPFRRGILDGGTTPNTNNSRGHFSGIQQSPLRRSIPAKHSFNLDNSSDSRSASVEASFELDASMQDTDSYWNDPLLAIMLKPSMDRDALIRSGGELGESLAAPPVNALGIGSVGGADHAAAGGGGGSASPTRNFHSRLETLQQTIRGVILQAPTTEQTTLMTMVTSWANRLSHDPLSENTSAAIAVVRLPKSTLSSSVSSTSLDTTISNTARDHPSTTRDEQQDDQALPVPAATTYDNNNDTDHDGSIIYTSNRHQQIHHYDTSNNNQNPNKVGTSFDASSSAPAATGTSTSRNNGLHSQQMSSSMIVSPTISAVGASASPSSLPNNNNNQTASV